MHNTLGAKHFVPAEANMEVDRMCGSIWAFGCFFAIFEIDTVAEPFGDMACREFNVLYKEHMYGCPMGLYASIGP